jgi:hypothetical protein
VLIYILQMSYGTRELDFFLGQTRLMQSDTAALAEQAEDATPEQTREILEGVEGLIKGLEALRDDLLAWARTRQHGSPDSIVPVSTALANVTDVAAVPLRNLRAKAENGQPPPPAEVRKALTEMEGALAELGNRLGQVQNTLGAMQPPGNATLSNYSGPSSAVPLDQIRRDELGRPHLPAENVAYLGRSLFTDYLLAVEVAGTLLLIATVGAIAIAQAHKPRK